MSRRGVSVPAVVLGAALTQAGASGAVSASLVTTTVRTAALISVGQSVTPVVSTQAVLLAEEVAQTMFLSKLKVVTVVLLLALATVMGTGLAAYQILAPGPEPIPRAAEATSLEGDLIAEKSKAQNRPVTDRYGDPLPPGAMARLGTVRMRHGGGVCCTAFSPDGRILASGGEDQAIRLWDVATGKPMRALMGHQHQVNSLAFAPTGNTLASASRDGTVRLWDISTGKQLRLFSVEGVTFSCVVFSPDGRTLAASAYRKAIHLWEVATGKEVLQLKKHQAGGVSRIAFSPDGKMLVSAGGEDKTLCLWEVATGRELRQFDTQPCEIFSVAFSSNGKTLAGGGKGGIHLWEAATGKEIQHSPIATVGSHPWLSRSVAGPLLREVTTRSGCGT